MLLCVSVLTQSASAKDNYYRILRVRKDATQRQIKRSFNVLSKKWHPDKNKGNAQAKQKFLKIQRAYEVLSDPDLRQAYDVQGEAGVKAMEEGGQTQGNGIFDFFGGGARGKRKGPDFRMDVSVTLADLYLGEGVCDM